LSVLPPQISIIFLHQSADNPQFDNDATISVEVTLSDASIFAPSATNIQTGFRRAELQPASNNGTDPSTLGIKTLHFSLRKDDARPLNTSHEYQLVFLEDAAFSTNQFVLKTGTIAGQLAGQDPDLLVLQGNVRDFANVVNLFNVSFVADTWHNFGLVLDFTAK
jgi:Glycoside hydrolase 131 catalytic N-terminal domain